MPTASRTSPTSLRARARQLARGRFGRGALGAAMVAGLLSSCSGGGSSGATSPAVGRPATGPSVPPPALIGGLDLEPVDPAIALVGDGLAYGSPLPSTTASLEVFRDDAEVRDALVREARDEVSAAPVAHVTLLQLDGAAFFDERALDAYTEGLLMASPARPTAPAPVREDIAGTEVWRVDRGERASAAWRRGDLLVVVDGPVAGVDLVLTRSLAAVAEGRVGDLEPRTPLPPHAEESPLVEVPSLSFVPFPDPEDEDAFGDAPEPPTLPGGFVSDGRIGVVGGERRATVWVIATSADELPTVESLEPLLVELAEARSPGGTARSTEVLGRVVFAADGSEGRSARVFRHGRTVLLVEGADPAQLDASVSAWLAVLPPLP